jgi:hypothetical protein
MVAHSTPKTGVEWGTQSLGCLCRERSLLSRLASASGVLEMTNLLRCEMGLRSRYRGHCRSLGFARDDKGEIGVSMWDRLHGSQVAKSETWRTLRLRPFSLGFGFIKLLYTEGYSRGNHG